MAEEVVPHEIEKLITAISDYLAKKPPKKSPEFCKKEAWRRYKESMRQLKVLHYQRGGGTVRGDIVKGVFSEFSIPTDIINKSLPLLVDEIRNYDPDN